MDYSVLSPSSISKKQSADFKANWSELSDHDKRVLRNRKRGCRITTNARINVGLHKTVCDYIIGEDLNNSEMEYFTKLRRSLSTCCQHSLYRQYEKGNALEYIASQTCKHKLCKVCNTEREKSIRRKYLAYFRRNNLVDKKSGEVSKTEDFDFMHLTLTVPHTEQGFQGKTWYATEIMQLFNKMRKCDWWKYHVWGGEFGVEVTKNESGLHIHIHALLIVRKEMQNRNNLHRAILLKWNELTIDKTSKRSTFERSEIEAIQKGNKTITELDVHELNPKGATLIGLESLYVLKDKRVSKFDKWLPEKSKWKHYIDTKDEKDFMAGILECLKYHFEPVAFDKENGVYQFELLREILPNIFRKPLYRKFGNLHGVKELNINDNGSLIEETKETLEEIGDVATNPDTGEEDSAHTYVIVSARNVFYDLQNNYKPSIPKRAKRFELNNQRHSLLSAVQTMIDLQISSNRKPRGEAINSFIHSLK